MQFDIGKADCRYIFTAGAGSGGNRLYNHGVRRAKVAELADAPDLGSGGETHGGSSPPFRTRIGIYLLLCGTLIALQCLPLLAQAQNSAASEKQSASAQRDARHDFDWDIGTWKTHQRRLLHPLSGSTTWVEYNGTDLVKKIWDGANEGLVEADGPAGHLEIYTLRVYNPDSHQWNIYFTNPATGTLSPPAVGEFKNGKGKFYDQESFQGRAILVRFSVSDMAANSCRFEQAFSADGGKTWEVNFMVTETRVQAQ